MEVIPYFPPGWAYGGPCRIAFGLSQYLASKGHEVTVFTTDAMNERTRISCEVNTPGMSVVRFRNLSNYLAWNRRVFLSPGLRTRARKTVASYDIVHLHEYRSYQNLVVAPEARKQSVPVVVQAHGSLPTSVGNVTAKKLFDTTMGKRLVRCITGAVALNHSEAKLCTELGIPRDMVRVIPNAIDPETAVSRESTMGFREKLGIPPQARVVIYLGRLHRSKGIEILVEAMALRAHEDPSCALVLAGPDDGMATSLKKLASKRGIGSSVSFAGYLDEETRLAAIGSSDVLVIPCFTGFPVTILEAYALGVPVLTTTASDELDWLNQDVACIVPFDPKAVSAATTNLLLSPSMRKSLGARGRAIVVDRFNWSVVGGMYETFYDECVGRAERTD